ncbi:unnamed protein product [Caenorhabditis bovis]|uniref:Uncharacterized protein n=1 Tax=Caenorhabditis bovis TaxID=2654633 RepID=A0A8S1EJ46_9PELO|nr:unnamed protein product [Caenorhabditis bovis]
MLKDKPAERIDFFVNIHELSRVCAYFEKFDGKSFLEFATNCTSTVALPVSNSTNACECESDPKFPLSAQHFHAFLEAACPSIHGLRPAPIEMCNVIPVLSVLRHFPSEAVLTNCERFLMKTSLSQLDGSTLLHLIEAGINVHLDHKILARILCVCLMNVNKIADVSQELTGNVGALFAQAFVANATKGFRHVRPLEQENVCPAVRELIRNSSGMRQNTPETTDPSLEAEKGKTGRSKKKKGCDHLEDSFECILCFDTRCTRCKGEAAFCFKAIDNFLYEVRLQLFPHTYRSHLDREFLREGCINNYIMRHQLLPLPNQ